MNRIIDRPEMTSAVYRGRKANLKKKNKKKQKKKKKKNNNNNNNKIMHAIHSSKFINALIFFDISLSFFNRILKKKTFQVWLLQLPITM